MEQDFSDRVKDYQRLYHVGIVQTEAPGLYKYYSTQRPVDIGTFPKPPHNAPDEIVNYDRRIPVRRISGMGASDLYKAADRKRGV